MAQSRAQRFVWYSGDGTTLSYGKPPSPEDIEKANQLSKRLFRKIIDPSDK